MPDRTYHIAYKNSLSDLGWTDFGVGVIATASLTSWTDPSAAFAQRYYAVYVVD